MFAAVWGSTLVVDGKVYLGDEDGDVVILQAGKTKKVLAEMNMGSAVYATPVPAHGGCSSTTATSCSRCPLMGSDGPRHTKARRSRSVTRDHEAPL